MKPKLILFQNTYINMAHVTFVEVNPAKVIFNFQSRANYTFENFDRTEYKDLQENLKSLM